MRYEYVLLVFSLGIGIGMIIGFFITRRGMYRRYYRTAKFYVLMRATQGPRKGCWLINNTHDTLESARKWVDRMGQFWTNRVTGEKTVEMDILSASVEQGRA